MAQVRIGTSGWHYDDWIGAFYPEGTRKADLLRCYGERFDVVEVNNSFYSLPAKKTLAAWREQTPPDFCFACKASRFITHMKKLKDPEASGRKFFDAVGVLEDKLGPILFQLPPGWNVNAERLADFLETLPRSNRYVFEFRNDTWFTDEVFGLLSRHNAALCIYDLDGRVSPKRLTADFAYVRLHGPDGPYQGSYDDESLHAWADSFRRWRRQGRDVYCFFDNDQKAHAPHNARRLIELLKASKSRRKRGT